MKTKSVWNRLTPYEVEGIVPHDDSGDVLWIGDIKSENAVLERLEDPAPLANACEPIVIRATNKRPLQDFLVLYVEFYLVVSPRARHVLEQTCGADIEFMPTTILYRNKRVVEAEGYTLVHALQRIPGAFQRRTVAASLVPPEVRLFAGEPYMHDYLVHDVVRKAIERAGLNGCGIRKMDVRK